MNLYDKTYHSTVIHRSEILNDTISSLQKERTRPENRTINLLNKHLYKEKAGGFEKWRIVCW